MANRESSLADPLFEGETLLENDSKQVKFPGTTQLARVINGVHTDIVISEFANCLMVSITQIGTFGTVIEATEEMCFDGRTQSNIFVRLGRRDDPLLLIYARQIYERVGKRLGKSILLTIGLKDRTPGAFNAIMNLILASMQGSIKP